MPSSRDNASIHGSQRKPPGSPPHSRAPGVITAQVQSQLHGREMTVAGACRPHLPRRAGDGTRAANPGPAHPCPAIKWLCDLRTWTGTGRKQLKRAPWSRCTKSTTVGELLPTRQRHQGLHPDPQGGSCPIGEGGCCHSHSRFSFPRCQSSPAPSLSKHASTGAREGCPLVLVEVTAPLHSTPALRALWSWGRVTLYWLERDHSHPLAPLPAPPQSTPNQSHTQTLQTL